MGGLSQSLGTAVVNLSLDAKQFTAGATQAEHAANKLTRNTTASVDKMSRGLSVGMNQALKVTSLVSGAIAGVLTIALGKAASSAMNFNSALSEVNTLGVKSIEGVRRAVLDVSTAYGQDLTTATKAAYQAISAGAEESKLPLVLAESAKAAAAGVSDLATAVTLGLSVQNAFGDSVKNVTQVFNESFTAVKLGVTTFGELASSVGKVAPMFSAMGLQSSEMFAAVTALTKGGIATAEAVTGLKGALTGIIKPTTEATDEAARLGIQFNVAALRSKGLSVFLQEIQTATGGNVESLAKLFGSVEGLNAVLALTGEQAKSFNGALTEMRTSTNALDVAFRKFTANNPAFEFSKIKAEVAALTVEVGDKLLPALNSLMKDNVIPLVKGLGDFVKTNQDLTASIVEGTAKFALFAAGVATLTGMAWTISKSWAGIVTLGTLLKGVLISITAAFITLTLPVALVIGWLGILLYKMEQTRDAVNDWKESQDELKKSQDKYLDSMKGQSKEQDKIIEGIQKMTDADNRHAAIIKMNATNTKKRFDDEKKAVEDLILALYGRAGTEEEITKSLQNMVMTDHDLRLSVSMAMVGAKEKEVIAVQNLTEAERVSYAQRTNYSMVYAATTQRISEIQVKLAKVNADIAATEEGDERKRMLLKIEKGRLESELAVMQSANAQTASANTARVVFDEGVAQQRRREIQDELRQNADERANIAAGDWETAKNLSMQKRALMQEDKALKNALLNQESVEEAARNEKERVALDAKFANTTIYTDETAARFDVLTGKLVDNELRLRGEEGKTHEGRRALTTEREMLLAEYNAVEQTMMSEQRAALGLQTMETEAQYATRLAQAQTYYDQAAVQLTANNTRIAEIDKQLADVQLTDANERLRLEAEKGSLIQNNAQLTAEAAEVEASVAGGRMQVAGQETEAMTAQYQLRADTIRMYNEEVLERTSLNNAKIADIEWQLANEVGLSTQEKMDKRKEEKDLVQDNYRIMGMVWDEALKAEQNSLDGTKRIVADKVTLDTTEKQSTEEKINAITDKMTEFANAKASAAEDNAKLSDNWMTTMTLLDQSTSTGLGNIIGYFKGLAENVWGYMRSAAEAMGLIDPNVRHSPSLVDRVRKGTDDISASYLQMAEQILIELQQKFGPQMQTLFNAPILKYESTFGPNRNLTDVNVTARPSSVSEEDIKAILFMVDKLNHILGFNNPAPFGGTEIVGGNSLDDILALFSTLTGTNAPQATALPVAPVVALPTEPIPVAVVPSSESVVPDIDVAQIMQMLTDLMQSPVINANAIGGGMQGGASLDDAMSNAVRAALDDSLAPFTQSRIAQKKSIAGTDIDETKLMRLFKDFIVSLGLDAKSIGDAVYTSDLANVIADAIRKALESPLFEMTMLGATKGPLVDSMASPLVLNKLTSTLDAMSAMFAPEKLSPESKNTTQHGGGPDKRTRLNKFGKRLGGGRIDSVMKTAQQWWLESLTPEQRASWEAWKAGGMLIDSIRPTDNPISPPTAPLITPASGSVVNTAVDVNGVDNGTTPNGIAGYTIQQNFNIENIRSESDIRALLMQMIAERERVMKRK